MPSVCVCVCVCVWCVFVIVYVARIDTENQQVIKYQPKVI